MRQNFYYKQTTKSTDRITNFWKKISNYNLLVVQRNLYYKVAEKVQCQDVRMMCE